MDTKTYINSLIAQYLKDNNLKLTLNSFEQELNTKFNNPIHDESLNSIINDRINFKKIQSFPINQENNINTLDAFNQSDLIKAKNIRLPNWSIKYPDSCEILNLSCLNSLIIDSSFFQSIINNKIYNLGLFITNTKYLFVIDINSNEILLSYFDPLNGKPIKIVKGITFTNHLIICDMNGNITSMKFIIDNNSNNWNLINSIYSIDYNLKLHRRLITNLNYLNLNNDKNLNSKLNSNSDILLGYFSSIGWDNSLTVGKVEINNDKIKFSLIGDYKLFTNPTCLLLTKDEKSNLPLIIVGRLESSLLTIFTIYSNNLIELSKLSLNDSEFSSHSFQPMALTEISTENNDIIITVATDHIPYMRLITVIVPSINEIINCELKNSILTSDNINFNNNNNNNNNNLENLNLILSNLQLQNKDNIESFQSKTPILRSYIISNFNSLSPQDKYSNAILLSRPKCSGVWIPGDDGKLRGFDLRTGSVIETLNSNDGRAKSAFIGKCSDNSEVIVVCGAVDKKICIWKCSS